VNIILLSGGSGKRLWPLSNKSRSKQFLKLLKNENNEFESMVQRVYRQIQLAGIQANIIVATGQSQVDSIRSQLGNSVDIVLEPDRRDTFPAIALSSAYLAFEKKIPLDEVIVVMPVDPYTDLGYFTTLIKVEQAAKDGVGDLVLIGIKPKHPSEKYGYIVPLINKGGYFTVQSFTEKPTKERAVELISEGAFWNGGVFAFKLDYLMNIVNKYVQVNSFEELRNKYLFLKQISFDYEVVEKASTVAMIPYDGEWKDLGTWNTLTEEMDEHCMGRATLAEDRGNTYIINELDIPIVALGTRDLVIAASPDGILISDKESSSRLKSYMDKLEQRPMYEERSWGEYKVLDYIVHDDGNMSLTKHLKINTGEYISYQVHAFRDEIWTIVDGTGILLIEGHVRNVKRGDVSLITRGQKHSIRAITDLRIIEVQIGAELTEEDIVRYDWEW